MAVTPQRSSRDLKDLPEDATLEKVIEEYNSLIKAYNFATKNGSISNSFDGYVAENVVFSATGASDGTDSRRIQHYLGFTPKFRIILRQVGNGVLEDVISGWNNTFATIKNRGSEQVTATIIFLKE
jgi:hypothetical protein